MNPFPGELWTKIFGEAGTKDLLAISRTCRPFGILAQDILYHNVALNIHRRYEHPDNQTMILFCRTLNERPDLTGLVRELKLRHGSHGENPPATSLQNPILRQIRSFYHLQFVRLDNFHIDGDLCTALGSLPFLTSLECMYCSIDPTWTNSIHIPASMPRRILDLSLLCPTARGWNAVISPDIRSLHFQFHDTDEGESTMWTSEFILHNHGRSLTTLNISGDLPSNIVPLLTSLPQLRRIDLREIEIDYPTFVITFLPADTIPLLEYFLGPTEYSEIFIRGRPVHSVELELHQDDLEDAFRPLTSTSVPVTDLELFLEDFEDYIVPPVDLIKYVPPTVRHLELSPVTKELVTAWVPIITRMTDLRSLELTVSIEDWVEAFDVPYQKDITHIISAKCPSLCEVRFDSNRWCRANDGHWEHYTAM